MAAGSAHWSSRFVFLMASVGFAVGLGNIWRFPYITGENGGAAFVLVYLACAFGIGAPILIAEMLIGRRGQGSPTTAVARVAAENGSSRHWQWVGGMGLLAAFTIEIVYAVVVGWVLWYLFKAINTGFLGFDGAVADAEFAAVLDNSVGMLAWTLVGLAITGMIIYAGVKDGIERAVIILMPLMFLLLAVLAVYNYFMPPSGAQANGFSQAITWLFTPDFSKIGFSTVLADIGQAFFALGVAMAGMMVYGAYMPKSIPLTRSVLLIVTVDTGVALLAGLVVFPVVFQNGLDPWVEERFSSPRHQSALLVVGSIAVLSVLSILSYNVMSDWALWGKNFNDIMDVFSNQILLPLGGLLIAVFAGWAMTKEATADELNTASSGAHEIWRFLIRFVVPPAVAVIFVMGIIE